VVYAPICIFSALAFLIPAASRAYAQEAAPTRAEAGIYMKLPGLGGELEDADRSDWIDVLSLAWGTGVYPDRATQAVRRCSGYRAGESVVGELTLTRSTDEASSALGLACTEGRHFPVMFVELADSRSAAGRYIRYELQDVMMTSYSISIAGDSPTESFTFDFVKAESRALPEAQQGKLDPAWDVGNSEP